MKKIFLFFVAICLLISLIPVNCFAEDIQLENLLGNFPYDLKKYVLVIFSDHFGEYYNVYTSTEKYYFDKVYSGFSYFNLDGYAEVSWASYKVSTHNWVNGKANQIVEEGDRLVCENMNATVLYSNYDIYDNEGNVYFERNDIDFWANVNIVLPPDGFMDNIHAFSIGVITDFSRILTNDEIRNINIEVLLNGVKAQSGEVIYNKMSNGTYHSTNDLQLLIDVPVGLNEVEVQYYYDDVLIGSDSVTFTRLAGFVDEDGDGLDDRTGNTYVPERPIDPIVDIEKPEKPGEDGNAIDWLKYLGEYIGYIFEVLINSISNFAKNVVSGVGSVLSLAEPMFSFINQFFSSMPVEIRTAIIAMFSVSVFLVIMKMIRG